jgi:hypothetical protein
MRSPTWFTRVALLLAWLPGVALAGCDSLFDVENPTDITDDELQGNQAQFLNALLNVPAAAGAEQYGDAVTTADLIADDIMQPGTNVTFLLPDWGDLEPFNEKVENLYNGLAEAWWHAQDATSRIRQLVANPDANAAVGRGYYWDGLLRVTMADLFEEVTFSGGPPLTPVQVYDSALIVLARAAQVAKAAGDATYETAAYATIARVHRSLYFEAGGIDRLARAADFAQQALARQATFRLDALYQPPGKSNAVFTTVWGSLTNAGVGPRYIRRIDPVSGVVDPRVQHTETMGRGVHGPYVWQLKYRAANSPIPVSRWQEARLIIAEYRLATGDLAGALQQINLVRTAAGLPSFQSTDAAKIRDQLIYERQTEFWMELRNWQDDRYYKIYPAEWTPASREAGVNRRLPISLRERGANPNLGR